jgi:periplasmic protein CpxP/Spy
MNTFNGNQETKATQKAYRGACTALLALCAASSFAFATMPVYAQALPSENETAIQVQQINLRQLHDQLTLNTDQEVQWQAAIDAMRDSHASERMNGDQMQQRVQSMLAKPILDLDALHAAHLQTAQQDDKLPEQSAQAWLKLYRGLNDQQKRIFSDALRPQLENISHHPARPYDPRTGL